MTSNDTDIATDLISIVAHDLKTPLIAAHGFLELVREFGELNDSQTMYLGKTELALDRMGHLITTMLTFSHLEAGIEVQPAPVDLVKEVADALVLLEEGASQREITITIEGAANEVIVNADPHLIGQVIHNLIANAIKYNDDGGKIIIRFSEQGSMVLVEVADTGVGISPDQHEKVFDKFYRAHAEHGKKRVQRGSGLGLAIAKAIVEMHGGDIWVDSTSGVGSTFSFTVPVSQAAAKSAPSATSTKPNRRFAMFPGEASSEESDAVDDDSQESADSIDSESRRDEP